MSNSGMNFESLGVSILEEGIIPLKYIPKPNAGGYYEAVLGNGSATSFTIEHKLNTLTPNVNIINQSTSLEEGCKIEIINANKIKLSATAWEVTPPGNSAYRVSVDASSGLVNSAGSSLTNFVEKGEIGAPNGVASSSVVSSSSEPTVYVTKNGNDTNSGRVWGQAFLTIKKATEYLESLSGKSGIIEVGVGVFTENKIIRPTGCLIRGAGFALTKIVLANGQNSNVIQDASWGNTSTIGDGGGIEKLTVNGNKANQTLIPPQCLLTKQVTVSGASVTLNVDDATNFNSAGLGEGSIWLGATRCVYTGLKNTGTVFNPSKPTESGWEFTGVTTVGGNSSTYYPEAIIIPGAQFGHGLAIQSSRTTIRDVLVEQCIGSGRAYQGSQSLVSYENKSFNVRAQQCNRYNIEVNPNAPDGMSSEDVGGNCALGDLLIMAADWQFHDYHPTGVASPNYNARNASHAVTICAPMIRFEGAHLDTFPYGQFSINTAWVQQQIYGIYINGDVFQPSWAASGAGNGISFYGQQDPGNLQALDVNFRLGLRGRLLHAIVYQPTTETILVTGSEYKTPASGAEGTKLQVLNALSFSPLGSAIAGTIQLTSSAGAALDTINYTGKSFATAWVAKEVASKSTTLEVDSAASLASSGTVTIYPQSTSEAGVEVLIVTYTEKEGNILKGIPAEGNGSISEKLPVGAGVAQHYLTGVTSTGAGGVSVPNGSAAWQTGGATGRQVGTVSGEAHIDTAYHRRTGALTYPTAGTANLRMRIFGRILNRPNPFFGTVSVAAGQTTGKVAHNLSTTPTAGFYGAIPTNDPQQRWWITASATELTVTLASAASGTAANFNVWAQTTPN